MNLRSRHPDLSNRIPITNGNSLIDYFHLYAVQLTDHTRSITHHVPFGDKYTFEIYDFIEEILFHNRITQDTGV
jgi:hypothetical protein